MPNRRFVPLLAAGLILVVACTAASPPSAAPPGGTSSPVTPSASPGSSDGGPLIEHPTGATDVVLRYDLGGGLMFPEAALTEVPIFTLYGDGTAVFRDPSSQPPAGEDGLLALEPLRTARLSEEQVQSLLSFAATEGGLAAARDRYDHGMIADAPTTTFTINAGGRTKTVAVQALSDGDATAPDPLARRQFAALAERLRGFDQGGSVPTDEYTPHGWRAVLVESPGAPAKVHPWPWPDVAIDDFEADPAAPGWPAVVLDADQVAALGLGELNGGLIGYYVKGPDGKTYGLPIRPLLPEEER